jgi:hypothetical protein
MKLNTSRVVTLAGGAIIGNMVAERWILRAGPDDPTGFVDIAPGLGLDELMRALAIVGATMLVEPLVRKVGL